MEEQIKRRPGRPPKASADNKFGPRPGSGGPQHIHPAFRDKEPTKPWTKEGANPWRMDMLRLGKSRPGFHACFVSPRKIEQRLSQGYTFANAEHYGLNQRVPGEGQEPGTQVKRREMVLMEIPIEKYEERRQYLDNVVRQREAAVKRDLQREFDQAAAGSGHRVPVTGAVTETGEDN